MITLAQSKSGYLRHMHYTLDWVRKRFDNGESLKYVFFWGHTQKNDQPGPFVFSQWYPSSFIVDGIEYKTAEHWMMGQKARLFHDEQSFKKLSTQTNLVK